VANAELTVDKVDDREKLTLMAKLVDTEGRVVSYSEYVFEVFEDTGDASLGEDVVYIDGLTVGEYEIAGEKVVVSACPEAPRYFVSSKTGHKAVEGFREYDFAYWYDAEKDRMTPIAANVMLAKGFTPILFSIAYPEIEGDYKCKYGVIAEKIYEGKRYIVSTMQIRRENPIAKRFWKALCER